MINKSILLILPVLDFNEQEYLTIYAFLIKNGFRVFIASDAHTICVGKNGLKVKNDISFFNMREANFAGIIIIGGKGVKNYWDNSTLHNLVKKFLSAKKIIGAICSAPVILAKAGILIGLNAVCFPEDRKELEREGALYTDSSVVVSKKIITAKDASSSQEFAAAFINGLN